MQRELQGTHLKQEVKESLQQRVALSLRLLLLPDLCPPPAGQGGGELGYEVNGAFHGWLSVVHHHGELDQLLKLCPEGILPHLKADSVKKVVSSWTLMSINHTGRCKISCERYKISSELDKISSELEMR